MERSLRSYLWVTEYCDRKWLQAGFHSRGSRVRNILAERERSRRKQAAPATDVQNHYGVSGFSNLVGYGDGGSVSRV